MDCGKRRGRWQAQSCMHHSINANVLGSGAPRAASTGPVPDSPDSSPMKKRAPLEARSWAPHRARCGVGYLRSSSGTKRRSVSPV
jgi:hypothetical protein